MNPKNTNDSKATLKKLENKLPFLKRIKRNKPTVNGQVNESISVDELLSLIHLVDQPEVPSLSDYFHLVVDHSVGLRTSQLPFNSHPDLMRRFIRECFDTSKVSRSRSKSHFSPESLSKLEFTPSLRFLVESAQDLPPMDANNSCDPYFKVFAPNDKCVFISHYIERDRNPVWQAKCAVPLTW
jgi:hypothetical protein